MDTRRGALQCVLCEKEMYGRKQIMLFFGKVMLLNLLFKLVVENMNCRKSDNLTRP